MLAAYYIDQAETLLPFVNSADVVACVLKVVNPAALNCFSTIFVP
jgi:hypothetical protein